MGEEPESVSPEYDCERTQAALLNPEKRIIKLKHAINIFNTSHKLPGFELTVDKASFVYWTDLRGAGVDVN